MSEKRITTESIVNDLRVIAKYPQNVNAPYICRLAAERLEELEEIENKAWDAGFDAGITEGGYRVEPKVIAKTLIDFQTRVAVHIGTYTDSDVMKVSDVIKLVNTIVLEILEDEE